MNSVKVRLLLFEVILIQVSPSTDLNSGFRVLYGSMDVIVKRDFPVRLSNVSYLGSDNNSSMM